MTRASTGSEVKRNGTASGSGATPRLAAAGKRALEAHARVVRSAARLEEELEKVTSVAPLTERTTLASFDPEDSMVIAVEKAIATAKGS